MYASKVVSAIDLCNLCKKEKESNNINQWREFSLLSEKMMSKDLQKIEQNAAFEFLELLTGFIISENLLRGYSKMTSPG